MDVDQVMCMAWYWAYGVVDHGHNSGAWIMIHLNDKSKSGFSLIELLLVLSILAILAGLALSGIRYVRIRQQNRVTEQTLFKLQEALDQLVKATSEQVRRERITRSNVFTGLLPYCSYDEDRAEALLLNCRLRHTFPVTFAEAGSNLTIPAAGINWPPHTAYADLPAAGGPAELESAVLLHHALSRLGVGGANFASDDVLGSAQTDTPLGRAFVDAWGPRDAQGNFVPIRLRRFDTATPLPFPFADPLPFTDPLNKLAQINISPIRLITVQSAGPNRKYDDSDDIWGYRLRQLGARGNNLD
jgi:prepilin-type N-terminal cleavage/methylation domain-containing protein